MDLLLSSITAVVAATAAAVAFWNLYQKLQAQRELVMLLRKHVGMASLQLSTNPPSPTEIQRYVGLIEEELQYMEEPRSRQILEGLHQRSTRGQEAYVVKVAKKANAVKHPSPASG